MTACLTVGLALATVPMACTRRDSQAATEQGAPVPPPKAARSAFGMALEAQQLYIRHCAACHGLKGHGDGPAAEQLYPKPRAFLDSPFRFVSAAGAEDVKIQAVERTILRGVPRSAMPGFGGMLTDAQVEGLARYVWELTRKGDEERVAKGIAAPPPVEPPRLAEAIPAPLFDQRLVDHGAMLFTSLTCVTCHGTGAHGDAPGTGKLVDSMGRPVRPADLASGVFKSGSANEDLYRTIVVGVPGTPMPPFHDKVLRPRADGTIDDSDVWALVAYIKSLARPRLEGVSSGAVLRPVGAADPAMLMDGAHTAWLKVPTTTITLRPLWQRVEAPVTLDIRIVRSGDRLAINVSWSDATPDVEHDSGKFPDAVAIMFALGDEIPALPMGVSVEGHQASAPVNLWQWKASRQYAVSMGRETDTQEPLVLPAGNFLAFGPAKPDTSVKGGAAERGEEQDLRTNAQYNRSAEAVGNVHSDPKAFGHAVLEGNAEGFGTLTYQPAEQQDVNSTAIWANGRWFVTIVRNLKPGETADIDLSTERRIPVAFAVWDGSRGDRDGIKHVSGWHWLVVNP